MSSEQVERLETYFVFIDGDEDEPEQVYLKSDADDVIRSYRQEVERLREAADEFFEIIETGNRAYPKDIFPEPPPGEHGKTVDACSASMGRHVYSSLMDEWNTTLGAALKEQDVA